MMKRSLLFFYSFIFLFFLASCNLFIEDEVDEEYGNAPMHTGYGYDAPVTESGDYYDVTYQYNSNVRVLTPEIQSYIREVRIDSTGWLACIDFALGTPHELLPVVDEIITCAGGEKFPEGIAHYVLASAEVDGVIRYATCKAEMDEVFKYLDMNVNVSQVPQVFMARTRADGGGADDDMPFKFESTNAGGDGHYHWHIPIQFNVNMANGELLKCSGFGNGESKFLKYNLTNGGKASLTGTFNINSKANETYWDHDITIKAKLVRDEVPFGIYLTDDWELKGRLYFTGKLDGKFRIFKVGDMLPATIGFPAGPVFLKVCCGGSLDFLIGASVDLVFDFMATGHTVIDADCWNFIPFIGNSSGVARDIYKSAKQSKLKTSSAKIAISGTGYAGLEEKISPGIGLYTEEVSVRAIIAAKFVATLKTLEKNLVGGVSSWSCANDPGINLAPDLGVGLGFVVPVDIRSALKQITDQYANKLGFMQSFYGLFVPEAIKDDYMEISDKLINATRKLVNEDGDGGQFEAGPFYFFSDLIEYITDKKPVIEKPWLPQIGGFWFTKDTRYTTAENQKVTLNIGYKVKNPGVWADWMGDDIQPIMVLFDSDNHIVGFELASKDKLIKKEAGQSVSFTIKNLPIYKEYTAYPGYYDGYITKDELLAVLDTGFDEFWKKCYFDKGEIVNTHVPVITMLSVTNEATTENLVGEGYVHTLKFKMLIAGHSYLTQAGIEYQERNGEKSVMMIDKKIDHDGVYEVTIYKEDLDADKCFIHGKPVYYTDNKAGSKYLSIESQAFEVWVKAGYAEMLATVPNN